MIGLKFEELTVVNVLWQLNELIWNETKDNSIGLHNYCSHSLIASSSVETNYCQLVHTPSCLWKEGL